MTAIPSGLGRREFLQVTGAIGVGLLIPCQISRAEARRANGGDVNAWVHVAADGQITIAVSESEMGQGTLTAFAMIVADELEADWKNVRAVHALADQAKYGRQSTGGSTSIRMGYDSIRKAGAAAREMLVAAAAATWGVPAEECRAAMGTVLHPASGRHAAYGDLAERAGQLSAPAAPAFKDPATYRYVGKPVKRLDSHEKVTGKARFGLDAAVSGLLVAQVVRPPALGGSVKAVDAAAAKAVPGVVDVMEIPHGVAVVAETFFAASEGRRALSVTWDDGPWASLSSESISTMLRDLADGGADARNDGDAAGAAAAAAQRLEAVYEAPYLAHATMEPMNCTAHVQADRCDIWVGTQAQTSSVQTAARITGLSAEQITLHTLYLGGGFGRRSQTDFVEDAVHLSKATGRPVKVVYTREDDTRAGWYRPVTYNALVGGIDAAGWPVSWTHRIAGASIVAQFGPLRNGIDPAGVEGAANLPYHIPNVHVTYAVPELPITTWWWRSVGSSQNAYVTECFLDELARKGGHDPVAYRQRLLQEHPRHLRVLETAAEKIGWGRNLPEGHALGIAVHECFGSWVAQAADVTMENDGPRVHRVVCAVDCGQAINPDTIAAQMDSGVIYGLSAALWGQITLDKGRPQQGNFDTYRVVRMREAPRVETHIVNGGDAHGGIGEPGTAPTAPAVCNAIFALTGKPVRRLPIRTG
ncbi:MAG: xanthine dehydrogenase family protein molybdopterin-binding subunit [Gemmatimonadota bacterium]|nr:xanthine dehydrogenase family protein molybdopterin-binding subunit [Gemmatimonadota bacterium]